jgi:hypothetical protein
MWEGSWPHPLKPAATANAAKTLEIGAENRAMGHPVG